MTDKTPLELLVCARELLCDEKHWIQGNYAKNDVGQVVVIGDPEACCFCGQGAVLQCANRSALWAEDSPEDKAIQALDAAASALYNTSSITANDGLGYNSIMRVFDKAIERLTYEQPKSSI